MSRSASRVLTLIRRALVAALWLLPAALQAQTVISALPYVISNPGRYQVSFNLAYGAASGAAITVAASEVDLDLGGFNLMGGSGATGISLSGVAQVRVRNGYLTGFSTGVQVTGGSSGVELTGLTVGGGSLGMYLVGQDLNVHANVVREILSTTGTATGIFVAGQSVRVWDNTVRNVRSTAAGASSHGILVNSSVGDFTWGSLEGNRIALAAGLSSSYGISVQNASTMVVLGNQILNARSGLGYYGSGGSIKYGNNIVTGATTAYGIGTDIGNNH
ncbi:MAG: right-handed parallel beta-helix repeat-containing protein [Acidobacteria bacterium]|nr:right-handed parallel beta-helix repeat-containing protein [Acidobacteriota bacterium]